MDNLERDGEAAAPTSSLASSPSGYKLFNRKGSLHQFMGGGKNVLLLLIVVMYVRANFAAYRDNHFLHRQTLPELVLSEEMVNNAAASFRVKINNVLHMAHDITVGKDFRLFFQMVICLWLLSAIGSYFSFFTLAYIGTILAITVPALYSRFEEQVDRCCGLIHNKLSQQYKIVDDNVISRIPGTLSKQKDT
ncbi:reticulon-like protein B16 isoform X4 [Mangifera indica]|uniref:reticulon-like protein B16 isoform X4 n=1 Tax=Mangifera indica TaxID=29780 RepID=UPI001CFA6940|nr:reticulon-like protein B16 isoform X4 [Mangifera indica]